ncbi:MAG: hypothetical protein U0793_11915 [Gemmataceae bacterium]
MSEPLALPPMTDAPISVLLTARGPASEMAEVLAAWRERLQETKREFELIVVGPESSAELALLESQGLPAEASIVRYQEPEGDGPALRAGVPAARHPLLLCGLCDKQYHPKDIDGFLKLINEAHLVCGYRVWQPPPTWLKALDGVKRVLARALLGYWPAAQSGWLGWGGWGRRRLARWLFGLRLHDVECRLRLFRKAILAPFPIQSRGEFALIEVLAKANHLGCLMAETPVSWTPPKSEPSDATFRADLLGVFRHPEFHAPALSGVAAEK